MRTKDLVAQLREVAKMTETLTPEQQVLTGFVMGLEAFRIRLRQGYLASHEIYFDDLMRTCKRVSNMLAKEEA